MRMTMLATTLALVAAPLAAQSGQSWLGIQGGYDMQNNSSRNAKDNGILGLTGGSWCTDRWGYDLSVLGTQLKGKNALGGDKADEYHGHLSGLFNLNPGANVWVPYLRAGLGATQVDQPWSFASDRTTRFSYNGGIGVQGLLAENFMLGLEARAVRIETRVSYTETLGLVTLAYRWGGNAKAMTASAPAPAPAPEPVPEPAPAPAPEVVAPAPAPEPAPVEPAPVKIVLDEAVLHFANGKNDLSPEGVQAVVKVAESLKQFNGSYTLVVSGHTSSVGSAAFNKALSKRRADAVAKVLVAQGIPAASVQTVGAGPDQPLADNKTKAGQARNRRVEIEVKVAGQQVETRTTETAVTE
jgi:OmpA-OmpF porin, OOP family